MKTVEEIPTADLIAELRELEKSAKNKPVSLEHVYARQVSANRHSDICYELDRRCVNANMESDGKGNLKTPCSIDLPITEFCLLCEWLIIKDGGNV